MILRNSTSKNKGCRWEVNHFERREESETILSNL